VNDIEHKETAILDHCLYEKKGNFYEHLFEKLDCACSYPHSVNIRVSEGDENINKILIATYKVTTSCRLHLQLQPLHCRRHKDVPWNRHRSRVCGL
jgi:hypothetical protein